MLSRAKAKTKFVLQCVKLFLKVRWTEGNRILS